MHRFIGSWSLETWTSGDAEPFGPDPQGKLVYTADGTMISAFMRRGRAPVGRSMEELAAWRWASTNSEEMERRFVTAALAFNSYSGRYSIEGNRVHHDVEIAMFPDWIGTRLSRVYEFKGDRLALRFGSDVLTWKRLGGGDGDALC